MDIATWLQDLGLERYVPAFHDNEIDWEVLPKLTSEDLREIGVAAIGHRRKLLDAISALGAAAPVATVTTAPSNAPAPADAERRQLTVMFCDLVGSTALSVPTALNVGVNSGPGACVRWGYSIPFGVGELNSLYPSHDSYVDQVVDVTKGNIRNNYIDPDDGQRSILRAIDSDVGAARH